MESNRRSSNEYEPFIDYKDGNKERFRVTNSLLHKSNVVSETLSILGLQRSQGLATFPPLVQFSAVWNGQLGKVGRQRKCNSEGNEGQHPGFSFLLDRQLCYIQST